jgi:enoyl-CoA hydratase/carnithine racemase
VTQAIKIEADGLIVRLTIDRADVRNAIGDAVCEELTEAIREANGSASTRAIVLTGAGERAFCAGADLKPDARTFGFDYAQPSTPYADLLRTAAASDLPLVARVNGHCMAGGMGLLAMCDLAVAAEGCRFGLPEARIGMFPMQVAALLRHLLPQRRFVEMCLTGEPITAEEALRWELINYVVPAAELDAKVGWLLERILKSSPTAIRRGKYALRAIAQMTDEQALAYMETQLGTLALTEDSAEGLASFNQKRAPVWTGR